jgi:hypothetical protein
MPPGQRLSLLRIEGIRQLARLCKEGFRLGLRLVKPETMRWIPRLLSEGIAPVRRVTRLKFIEAHNMREIKNLLAEGVPITFITSYPRSGNTWMRYLLSDVFLQNHGIDTNTKLAVHPDEIIADFYCSRVAMRNTAVRTPGVLLKSHDSFEELQERFWGKRHRTAQSFQRCRHLYLHRSPEDALVSLYHYNLREDLAGKRGKGGRRIEINAFCREALPGWSQHLSGYLAAAESGVPICFASYEQLLADPNRVLGEILQWLGVPHTGSILERAALNMQFQKLKATDARDMGNHGRSGAGSIELEASTIELIRTSTAHLVERANRRPGAPSASGEISPGAKLRDVHPNLETTASAPRTA